MDAQTDPTTPIRVGELLPDFTLPAWPEGEFTLSGERGLRSVVLYFYPEDDTPGCTRQACSLRDTRAEYARLGCRIVGVSADSLDSHRAFAEKFGLPFTLLSDSGDVLRARLGSRNESGELVARVTYIIDRQGVLRHIINPTGGLKVEDHLEQSRAWAQRLAAE
jgi:thioredoxin-dependent peroxiredoxin